MKNMRTIHIAEGITLYLAQRTAAKLEAEIRAEREWRRQQDALAAAERYGDETGDYSLYSDIFKDVYGIRPRW